MYCDKVIEGFTANQVDHNMFEHTKAKHNEEFREIVG